MPKCRARRPGLGQRETAQVAGRTAEGEGGPQAGICGCSEGCWQHAPDGPVQKEAASAIAHVRPGRRQRRPRERREDRRRQATTVPRAARRPDGSLHRASAHQQNAQKVSRGTVFRCSSARNLGAAGKGQGGMADLAGLAVSRAELRRERLMLHADRRPQCTTSQLPPRHQSETVAERRHLRTPGGAALSRGHNRPFQPEATTQVLRREKGMQERRKGGRGGGREGIQGLPPGPT